jgi:hypothetical protein
MENWKLFKTQNYLRKTNVWKPESPRELYQINNYFISDLGNAKIETYTLTLEEANFAFKNIKNPGSTVTKHMPYYEKGGHPNKRYQCLPTGEYIHRLVAEQFIPNPEGKPTVNHKDGDKKNNHWTNLEWMTHSENCKHASDLKKTR